MLLEEPVQSALQGLFKTCPVLPENLLYGKAVAIVDLVACITTEELPLGLYEDEKSFGDFSPGRYAWCLKNLRVIIPFRCRGMQGLFEVENIPQVGRRDNGFKLHGTNRSRISDRSQS
jgi:hypothetical protein